ncbi:VC0807 family protein [Dictyobacter kobayashii]|nr:VC0807 family protein [Dictyobacter kobayashii]
MSATFNQPEINRKEALRDLVISLLINVAVPLLLVYLMTTYLRFSELVALSVGSIVPIIHSVLELARKRRLDLVAVFFLLGVLTNVVAIFLGGNPQLLVIRESFFTGALGLFCLLSLLVMPRPLMFYVGRQMMVGNDPVRIQRFNASWQDRYVRSVHRIITIVWGVAMVGEFLSRVLIAYTLPVTLAYAIGVTILTCTLAGTFAWTLAYIRYATREGQERRELALQGEGDTTSS